MFLVFFLHCVVNESWGSQVIILGQKNILADVLAKGFACKGAGCGSSVKYFFADENMHFICNCSCCLLKRAQVDVLHADHASG